MAKLIAFFIWMLFGLVFVVYGIYSFTAKREVPFGFWANAKVAPIDDVKSYNRALGKLWIVFGVSFALLGFPLLVEQNSPTIVLTIIGTMLLCIVTMAVYTVGIEGKYRKR